MLPMRSPGIVHSDEGRWPCSLSMMPIRSTLNSERRVSRSNEDKMSWMVALRCSNESSVAAIGVPRDRLETCVIGDDILLLENPVIERRKSSSLFGPASPFMVAEDK